MKTRMKLPLLLGLLFLSGACLANDPPIDVPFTKVMNPGTAPEYQRKTVRSTVRFMEPGNTEGWIWIDIPPQYMDKKVVFRVSPLNTNPAAMVGVPPHVFIDKEKSDLVFELQSGEEIVLVGRPVIGHKPAGTPGPAISQIIFVAESVERAKGKKK